MASVMQGPLMKWTNVVKGWQQRWVALDDNSGLLSYYTSKEKMMKGARRGCVRLKGALVSIDDDDDCTFNITVDGKSFHFQARDAAERESWIRALEDCRLRHSDLWQRRFNPKSPVPTIDDFNKKLTESDAYLQIMIDQVKKLEDKIEACDSDRSRERLLPVKDKANEMLESIKHAIVLLQIAKNVAHPVNGVFQPNLNQETASISSSDKNGAKDPAPVNGDDSPFDFATALFSDVSLDAPIVSGIEAAIECFEEESDVTNPSSLPLPTGHKRSLTNTFPEEGTMIPENATASPVINDSPILSIPPNLYMPETSYSSSEDEDYFDAEDTRTSHKNPTDPIQNSSSILTNPAPEVNDPSPVPSLKKTVDIDAIYEDDDEEDLGSVESHGSVISHLLSQVRIGMDLTKVVLPTFILERRSLLEMYADFFAHPDLFVSIPDAGDPRERMVQVLRWYLSAFHAGRKSSVAKKPYNPILGEVFKCYWDIPGMENKEEKVADGPLPWTSVGQLSFVAEQVSHHPPISAFYAEHYDKRISLDAHIWTKSKFFGLSIGVMMLGQGCVSLVDHDEEYIVTFPNGYGRSILTIPWIELGGTTSITCAKTGYNANIEFITKPFYGGKKHRLSADVFGPNEKKPFLNVTGEWNGVMTGKWTDGRSEVFVDTTRISVIKKKVCPVSEQEPNESRRLWKDVTVGLKYRYIEQATKAKYQLEQRQRMEALERKEKGVAWETKIFNEAGDGWIYNNPLQKRLNSNQDQKIVQP
ncbi:hypothetical protein CHUAL_012984 [Chamberlinius hualienensis]